MPKMKMPEMPKMPGGESPVSTPPPPASVKTPASSAGSFAFDLPGSEDELLSQVQTCVQRALSDGKVLLDIEIPPLRGDGPGVGVGDSIAISEYNANQKTLRKVCALFEWLGQAERVRVFFPDASERRIAECGAGKNPASGQWDQDPTFHDWPGPVDHLLSDNFLSTQSMRMTLGASPDVEKAEVGQSLRLDDELYVIAYPYDSTEEVEQAMDLWERHARRMIFFNANLDAVRTGWFPFGRGKRLKETFLPQVSTVYYIRTFRSGVRPGILHRAYPGPWRVLRARGGGGFECVEETEERPELREVALQYFSSGVTSTAVEMAEVSEEVQEVDHYAVLGIKREASREEVGAAYRSLAKKHHPDVGDGDQLKFFEVTRAFAVLKDAEKRALYDVHGANWVEMLGAEAKRA